MNNINNDMDLLKDDFTEDQLNQLAEAFLVDCVDQSQVSRQITPDSTMEMEPTPIPQPPNLSRDISASQTLSCMKNSSSWHQQYYSQYPVISSHRTQYGGPNSSHSTIISSVNKPVCFSSSSQQQIIPSSSTFNCDNPKQSPMIPQTITMLPNILGYINVCKFCKCLSCTTNATNIKTFVKIGLIIIKLCYNCECNKCESHKCGTMMPEYKKKLTKQPKK